MDWFLYDRDLRHERVKNTFFTKHLRTTASESNSFYSFFTILLFRYTRYLGQFQYLEPYQTSMMEFRC